MSLRDSNEGQPMKFNEEKLRRLLSRADQMYAAFARMQDEYVEAKSARERYEMDLRSKRDRYQGYTPSAADNATLEHLKAEEQAHLKERDAAADKWRQARRVADSCERYAREVLGWAPERPGTFHGAIAHLTGGVLR